MLRRANQLLSSEDYGEAAILFEQLARAAEARGGPRAPFFYIQAGRTRVMAGSAAAGLENLENGLGLLVIRGHQPRATKVGMRLVAELKARGLGRQADQLTEYLEQLIPGFGQSMAATGRASAQPHSALPTHCQGCGAPLRPDEVEWVDESTASCAYCGTPSHTTTA